MEHFSKANKKDKKTIKKVVGRWKDKNFFDPMTMEDAMDAAGDFRATSRMHAR